MTPIRWGILGAAAFARGHMGPAIHAARGAQLVALGTSDPARAAPFEAFAPGLRVHAGYDAVLADPDIDAVYIPLPNHMHVDWTLKALAAGKHVLCEKPMALREDDFGRVIAARDASGLLAAEAFMVVHHPQFARARQIVQGGELGPLRHVQAAFAFYNDDRDNIRNQAAAGGGALADIGVYAFGAARFVTGEDPEAVTHARIDTRDGVDTYVNMTARFPGFGYAAMVSIRAAKRQELVFHGEQGVLTMTCPFNAGVHDQAELRIETAERAVVTERFPGVNHYVLQVEAFCKALREGGDYPCPLEFSRGTQRMVDMTRKAGG